MTTIYRLTSNYDEELFTDEQHNYLYGYDEECKTKVDAISKAREKAKQFNEKFNTNYNWRDIVCIELQRFDEYGDLMD